MNFRNAIICIVMYFLARAAFAAEVKPAAACPQPVAAEKCEVAGGAKTAIHNLSEAQAQAQRIQAENTKIEFRMFAPSISGVQRGGFFVLEPDGTARYPVLEVNSDQTGPAGWKLIALDNKEARLCKDGVEKVVNLQGLKLDGSAVPLETSFAADLTAIECDFSGSGQWTRPWKKEFEFSVDPASGALQARQGQKQVWPDKEIIDLKQGRDDTYRYLHTPGLDGEDVQAVYDIVEENVTTQVKLELQRGFSHYEFDIREPNKNQKQISHEEWLKSTMPTRTWKDVQAAEDEWELIRQRCRPSPDMRTRSTLTRQELKNYQDMSEFTVMAPGSGSLRYVTYRVFKNDKESVLVDPFGGIVKRIPKAGAK